jgi:putative transposase
MPRRARSAQASRCYHLCQRGHAGTAFCLDGQDRSDYIAVFMQAALGRGLWVHAWSVLDREAHWLVTPQRPDALSSVMQQLGRRYVRGFNRRWSRSGSPWDGRYRSYWIDSQAYGLSVSHWMESLPARQGFCEHPQDWLWSSAGVLRGIRPAPSPGAFRALESYWALGNTPFEREAAYTALADRPLGPDLLEAMQRGLSQGRPVLSAAVWQSLEEEERQAWVRRPRGRPRIDRSPEIA